MENIQYGYHMPPDLNVSGHPIDVLILCLHVFMILLFVGWGIFLLITLIKFRQRENHKASYQSATTKLPKFLELGVVLFEAFLLVGLSFPIWNRYKNDPPPKDQALTIRVVAQQFVWNFQYPGEDGKFGRTDIKFVSDSNPLGIDPSDPASADDFFTVNQMHIPVEKAVIVQISSKDVIHSFGVPVLRVKQDAIPGQVVPIWFKVKKPATFEILCSQLCGISHFMMKGNITAQSTEDFQKWSQEQPHPFKKEASTGKKEG